MKQRLWLLCCALVVLLIACAQGATTVTPPAIRYGEDLCAECNMIISDPRYAASYVYEISTGRYQSVAFDDIGDLLSYTAKHSEDHVVAWYVHDYTSEEWIDATTAYYVVSDAIMSPMGHGITAHAAKADAEAMAQTKQGQVFDWQGLLAQAQSLEQQTAHHH